MVERLTVDTVFDTKSDRMKIKTKKSTSKSGAAKYYACTPNKKKYEISFKEDKGVKIGSSSVDIGIIQGEDGFLYLTYGNKKYFAEIVEKNQNKYTILVNGVSYDFSIETPISYKRKKYLEKKEGTAKSQIVNAPMPGKIVEVLAEENSDIKQGDPLFILEAMKMQNEILSHVSGKVSRVNVKQNDSVVKGDLLVEIV